MSSKGCALAAVSHGCASALKKRYRVGQHGFCFPTSVYLLHLQDFGPSPLGVVHHASCPGIRGSPLPISIHSLGHPLSTLTDFYSQSPSGYRVSAPISFQGSGSASHLLVGIQGSRLPMSSSRDASFFLGFPRPGHPRPGTRIAIPRLQPQDVGLGNGWHSELSKGPSFQGGGQGFHESIKPKTAHAETMFGTRFSRHLATVPKHEESTPPCVICDGFVHCKAQEKLIIL